MKISKNVCYLLTGVGTSFFIGVLAEQAHAEPLHIETPVVTEEKIEVAKAEWEKYVANFIIDSGEEIDDFYLGKGFQTFSDSNEDTTNFPIVKKENKMISYILQIDDDNQIILSKKYGEKLNSLSKKFEAGYDSGTRLYAKEFSVIYSKDGKEETLLGTENSESIITENSSSAETLDITEVLEYPDFNPVTIKYDHHVLPWEVYEIQTDKPWCEFYAQTGIVNNLAGRKIITAEQMIREMYPNATEAQITDTDWIVSLSIIDNFKYLKNKYNIDVEYKMGKPDFSEVKRETKERKAPLLINLASLDGGYGHAITHVGYTANANGNNTDFPPFYYYWNPWWEEIFVASSQAEYLQLGLEKYRINLFEYNYSSPKL